MFNVNFWPDSSGSPSAAPLFTEVLDATVQSTGQRINTPNSAFDGNLIYRFETDLPVALTINERIPIGLSIIDVDSSTPQWLWPTSSPDHGQLAVRNTSAGLEDPWSKRSIGTDCAYHGKDGSSPSRETAFYWPLGWQ